MPHLMNLVRRDPPDVVGDPIVVIPTPLLRLSYDQASDLDALLAEYEQPNPFVDHVLLAESQADFFWIDLAQFVREAPDIAALYKGRGCPVSAGCRVNTKREKWLHTLLYQLEDGSYRREGTSWVKLQYAVLVSSASIVYADLAAAGPADTRCVWQPELPFVSLQDVPPMPLWGASFQQHSRASLSSVSYQGGFHL